MNTQCDVKMLARFLTAVESDPGSFTDTPDLRSKLKSQGGMAKMSIDTVCSGERVFYEGAALNTVRGHAEKIFPGGFNDLNRMRVRALDALDDFIAKGHGSKNYTKAYYKNMYCETLLQLDVARQANMVLLQAVSTAIFNIGLLRDTADAGKRAVFAEDILNDMRSAISIKYPLKAAEGQGLDGANVLEFKR
ncbi:hypothetical protein [Pseudomonas sp. URMO17WK12:I11]|uniref:hypothetical protein n=1 Tax=Pseudomonas sp. URMO17WK12:I11 TaxID=1283291 RepID=UPI0011A49CC0|nr:hypothetical protein [Pseudomonas sp. URMO17WK12:I11]